MLHRAPNDRVSIHQYRRRRARHTSQICANSSRAATELQHNYPRKSVMFYGRPAQEETGSRGTWSAQLEARAFPVLAVEGRNRHRYDGIAVDAASVDAHTVGMRPRNIKRFHAAVRAKVMFRDACVESVSGQIAAAGNEREPLGRHD